MRWIGLTPLLSLLLSVGCSSNKAGDWPLRATVQPSSESATFVGSALTVATYNLHGVRDPDGLRQDLHRIDADVWLFQEVIASADLRAILPDGARWNIAMVAVNETSDGRHGKQEAQAIATRLPIASAEVWPLTTNDSQRRRCALAARVPSGSSEILIVNTDHEPAYFSFHVAHEPQLRSLVERIGKTSGPLILGGDFNSCGNFWRFRSSRADANVAGECLAACGLVPATQPSVTFTAGPVRGCLDQIFVRDLRVLDAHVATDSHGSDHRPVVARVSISKP